MIADMSSAHYNPTGLRRGFASSSALIRASFIGAAFAMGTVISVTNLDENNPQTAIATTEDAGYQQETIKQFEQIFTGCIEVVKVANSDISPYSDYILWVNDSSDAGKINRSEILLLSHNRDLQSISIYKHDGSPREVTSSVRNGEEYNTRKISSGRDVLDYKKLSDAEFIDQWRSMASVSAETIAVRVSELSIKPLKSNTSNSGPLRIELIWSEYSTDAEDHGFFIVDATMKKTTHTEVKE